MPRLPSTVDVSFMAPGTAPLAVRTQEAGGNTFVTVDAVQPAMGGVEPFDGCVRLRA